MCGARAFLNLASMANDIAVELSSRLVALAEEQGKSVVRVEGRRRGASSGAVWSADGLVIAADHALESDDDVALGLADGRTTAAEVVGRDPTTGVALLRTRESGLAAPTWNEEADARPGQLLLGLSRPGRGVRASLGILSRAGETWRTPAGGRIDRYLELELPLQPGFSGGLVIDMSGRALGMATAGLLRGTGLAIPASTLRRVVKSLLAHGRVRRGYLGVATLPVELPRAWRSEAAPAAQAAGEADQAVGLLLTHVEDESPASRAGLLVGDVLLTVEGRTVNHAGDLLPMLEEERIGDALLVRLVRAGQAQEAKITIGARERAGRCRPEGGCP
jgi:S1-C subfamily serine protease